MARNLLGKKMTDSGCVAKMSTPSSVPTPVSILAYPRTGVNHKLIFLINSIPVKPLTVIVTHVNT